jgi:hypothetical protein
MFMLAATLAGQASCALDADSKAPVVNTPVSTISPASVGSIVGRTYGVGAFTASSAKPSSTSSSARSAETFSHTSTNVCATPTTCPGIASPSWQPPLPKSVRQ